MKKIESTSNPQFRRLRQLLTSGGIREQQRCLVSGRKLVSEILSGVLPAVATQVLLPANQSELFEELPAAPGTQPEPLLLAPTLFQELDCLGTRFPIVVAAVPEPTTVAAEAPPLVGPALVVPLQNPENLGAALRSALAFGMTRIYLTEESAHPFLPRAIRSAAGAGFRIDFTTLGKFAHLQLDSRRARTLRRDGTSLHAARLPRDLILVVGVEGTGLPDSLTHLPGIAIPIGEQVESLNATVALSIALYEWSKQHR